MESRRSPGFGAFLVVAVLSACSQGPADPWSGGLACDKTGAFDPDFAAWPAPVPPKREKRGLAEVVWLNGTPYEMGKQHGELLLDRMKEVWAKAEADPALSLFFVIGTELGLLELAKAASYPETIQECQGFVDFVQAKGVGFTMDHCLFLASGEIIEFVADGMPDQPEITPGCTQILAAGPATADGRLYHARLMDWMDPYFLIENPVVFVRQPTGGIPHVTIGFPGCVAPFQGMNARGIVMAQNEIHARDGKVHDTTGLSHTQLEGRILQQAGSLAEARALILAANHMTLETSGISDGQAGSGEFYEMAPPAVGVRTMTDGIAFATNHFVAPATANLDREPASDSTMIRWERLSELVLPGGKDTLYGRLDPPTLVRVLRDRVNPRTGLKSPDTFNDSSSLATDGAIYAAVFDPGRRVFWLASGKIVVPDQTFHGYSLGALLSLPGCEGTTPADIP